MNNRKNYSISQIKRELSEEKLKILELYLKRKKQKDIIAELGCKRGDIDTLVSKYKLTRFRDRKNYSCSLQKINLLNPKYWYFLGLFATDGNLYTCGGIEVIQFCMDDRDSLESVKNILKYTGPIQEYIKGEKLRYYLKISCSELIKSVQYVFKSDCHKKTFVLKFPKIPNNQCLEMFLRGISDGDGSFASSKLRKEGSVIFKFYSASKTFLEDFLKVMKTIVSTHICTYENHIEISNAKGNSEYIKFIYRTNLDIGIKRKQEKAMQHLNCYKY